MSDTPATSEQVASFGVRLGELFAACRKHKRTTVPLVEQKCVWGDCDHEDECPEQQTEVCAECYRIAEDCTDEYVPEEVMAHNCAVLMAVEALEPTDA